MLGYGYAIPLTNTLAKGVPWWRRREHLLDGVAPGFVLDVWWQRYALGASAVGLSALLSVTASAGKTYVDQAGMLRTAAANTPRIDWSSGAPELLLEGASTNLCAYSGDPASTSWSGIQINRVNGQPDPTGGTTASRVTCTAVATAAHSFIGNFSYTTGTTYTLSRIVRAGTQSRVQLTGPTASFGPGQYANFDLASGTVTAAVGCTASISALGSTGWYRIAITIVATGTVSAAASGSVVFIAAASDSRFPAVTLETYFFEAAPQCEVGSVATSYIPTAASAVTRTADLCQLTEAAAAVLRGAGGAVAWRSVVPTVCTWASLFHTSGGAFFQAAGSGPTQAIFMGGATDGNGPSTATAPIPGNVGFCGGWGASGRAVSTNGGAVNLHAGVVNRSLASLFVGPGTGLGIGQIFRVRQLVGWALANRPSAAGVQAQARVAT